MCGECKICHEHCLDCKCLTTLNVGKCIPSHSEPMTICINKEHFRTEFSKILEKWDQKLLYGIDENEKKELLNDLLNTM